MILPIIPLLLVSQKHFRISRLWEKLEKNFELFIHWFEDNNMKLNTDKCHLLISGHKYEHKWTQIVQDRVWGENKVKTFRNNNRQ